MNQARKTELRALAELFRETGVPTEAVAALLEALDEIDALENREAKAKEALLIFVSEPSNPLPDILWAEEPDDALVTIRVQLGKYKSARATLQELGD